MTFAMTQAEIIELLASIQSRAGKKLSRKLEKAIILSKSEKLTSKKLLQTLANPEKKTTTSIAMAFIPSRFS